MTDATQVISSKLRRLRKVLSWERKFKGDVRWNKTKLLTNIEKYEKTAEKKTLTDVEREHMKYCQTQIEHLYKIKTIKWRQGAKCKIDP